MDNMYKEPDLSKVEAIYNVVQNENVNKDAYDIAKKFLEQIGADTSKYSQVDFSLDEMKETIREYDKKNNTKVFDDFQSEYDEAFDSKRKALDGYKEQAEIVILNDCMERNDGIAGRTEILVVNFLFIRFGAPAVEKEHGQISLNFLKWMKKYIFYFSFLVIV